MMMGRSGEIMCASSSPPIGRSTHYSKLASAYLTHVYTCTICEPNCTGIRNNGDTVLLRYDTVSTLCPQATYILSDIAKLLG